MERIDALVRVGGSRWQKNGMDRIYFNNLYGWYGLEMETYKTGNISSASLDGEKISNSQAKKLESEIGFGKLWFDVPTGKWMARELNGREAKMIERIEANVAELVAQA